MTIKRKYIFLWLTGIVFVMLLISAFLIRSKMGHVPNEKELRKIRNIEASEIYSSDGVLLGRYFLENRTNVKYSEIPKVFLDALIATEDARFFEHEGIDYRSLFRVLVKSLILQDRSSGGGSTLSQQLAKNLYPRKGTGAIDLLASKLKEAIIASRLETLYSKEELLTLYLNTVSFGEDVYGLETAALRYFNKNPIDLKVEEAAVLVGLLKATTSYNPRLHPEQAKNRRNTVLSQMMKYGYLKDSQLDSLMSSPLKLDYSRHSNEPGTAPYYKAWVRPFLEELIKDYKKEDGSAYDLKTDGLKITLPIDSRLQYHAAMAVEKHLNSLQKLLEQHWYDSKPWERNKSIIEREVKKWKERNKDEADLDKKLPMSIYQNGDLRDTIMSPLDSIKHYLMMLQSGFLAIGPKNGEIKAWVGGINYNFFQYDHVLAKRQVGSTFKPIVYAAALENGIDPCDYWSNEQKVYQDHDNWSPGNADEKYEGYYSLKGALTYSVNTVSAQIMIETGIDSVISLAHKMGIEQDLPSVPSLALGTANLSLLEMVKSYAVIANGGKKVDPVFVLKIESAEGKVLWEHKAVSNKDQVISKRTSLLMTDFMQSVVNEGTARRLRSSYGLKIPVAGKTGTTQSHADGWFIGFTPDIVAGVWVGADNPAIHFRTAKYGQGASMALPVWALFINESLKDPGFKNWKYSKFETPDPGLIAEISCPLYKEDLNFLERIFRQGKIKKDRKSLKERLKELFGKGK